jgi:hypothetical protein
MLPGQQHPDRSPLGVDHLLERGILGQQVDVLRSKRIDQPPQSRKLRDIPVHIAALRLADGNPGAQPVATAFQALQALSFRTTHQFAYPTSCAAHSGVSCAKRMLPRWHIDASRKPSSSTEAFFIELVYLPCRQVETGKIRAGPKKWIRRRPARSRHGCPDTSP